MDWELNWPFRGAQWFCVLCLWGNTQFRALIGASNVVSEMELKVALRSIYRVLWFISILPMLLVMGQAFSEMDLSGNPVAGCDPGV